MARGNSPVNRTANIHINTASAEKALGRLETRSEKLSKAIKDGQAAGHDMKEELSDLANVNKRIEELKGIMSGELAPSIRMVQKRVRELDRELSNMSKDAPGYAAKFREFEHASKYLHELKGEIQGVDKAMHGQVRSKSGSFFSNIKSIAAGVLVGNTVQAGLDRLSGYFSNLVSGNAKLSDALADVEKNTGLTTKQVAILNKELSKINTRTPRMELLKMASVLGKQGENVTKEAIENIDKIAVALGDDFDGGAETITEELSVLRNNLNDFKTQDYAKDVLNLGNALNVLSAEGIAKAPVLVDMTTRMAGVGSAFGVTTDQILGTAATFEQLGIETEKGSTAFVRILQFMTKNVKAYAEIAEFAGIKQKDFVELVNKDIVAAFMKVSEGAKIAGKDNVKFGQVLQMLNADGSGTGEVLSKLSSNSQLYAEKIKLAGEALQKTDSITDEFNKKNNNLAGILDKVGKRMLSWFSNSTIKEGLTTVFTLFGELIGAIEHTNRSLVEFNKQKEKVAELDRDLAPLLDKIDQLKSKTNLTQIEQQELRQAIEDVGKALPLTITEIDNYGNAMDINSKKAREFIRLQRLALNVKNADAIRDQKDDIKETLFEIRRFKDFSNIKSKTGKTNEDYIRERYKDDPEKLAIALDKHNKLLATASQRLSDERNKLEGQIVLLAQISGKTYEQILQENEQYQIALNKMVITAPSGYDANAKNKGTTKTDTTGATGGGGKQLVSEEERKRIEAEYKKKLADQLRVQKAIEKETQRLAAKAKDAQDTLFLDHAQEVDKIVQKWEELMKLTHGNVKQMAELNDLQQAELDLLYDKQFGERSDKEYKQSLDTLHDFYLKKRQVVEQSYVDGKIDAQQYYDNIRQLDLEESEDRLTVVQDYVKTSTQAAKDAEKAKTDALAKGVQDRLRLERKEADAKLFRAERAVITAKLGTKKRLDAELALITEKYRQELLLAKDNAEAVKYLEAKRDQELTAANKQFLQQKISEAQSYMSAIGSLYSDYMNFLIQQGNDDLAREQAINDRKRDDYDKMLADKRIDEKTHKEATENLDKEYRAKEEALRRKQFKREKAAALGQAGIDGALAITGIWAQYGANPILAGVLTAVAAAALGIQIASIASKRYQSLAKGGITEGPSHDNGGMPVFNGRGQKVMELEGGEAVLSKKTVANNPTLVQALLDASMYRNGAKVSTDWVSTATPRVKTDMLYRNLISSHTLRNGGFVNNSSSSSAYGGTSNNSNGGNNDLMQLMNRTNQLLAKMEKNGVRANVYYKEIKEASDKYDAAAKSSMFKR